MPTIKTTFEMDIMNCNEYLGTAKVTYNRLDNSDVWTAELIPEILNKELENKMLECVDNPKDQFTRKYLSNSIFLIAPSDKKEN